MDRIRIETLGCRLNQIESESAAKFFIDKGFEVSMQAITASETENPDILLVIVNTCTVTQKSEQKARRLIRLLLKKSPNATILVTGCYAQLSPDEILNIDKRICVIGGQIKSRISEIPDLLINSVNDWNPQTFAALVNERVKQKSQLKAGFPEQSFKLATSSFLSHSRASLKIQDGCNSNCSYCAIHMARGHSVSIDVETAVARVKELEAKGQSEVVITTVNIGQYKSTYNGESVNFTKLLKILLESTSRIMFRISSLYPEIVDDDFCSVIKDDRVCPHFHISVQSGSNKILRAMNRAYDAQCVITACEKLKKAKDNPFLACDIITGFPGETDADFDETMDLCKKCDFAWVHAFPFSERPGTVAATMKNKVPQSVSGERCKKITQWAIEQKIKYVEKFAGKQMNAVFETVKRPAAVVSSLYIYHAVTPNFIHCEVTTSDCLMVNNIHKIEIESPLKERIIKGGEIEAVAKII